ncbi:MAG: hypothetical protein ACOZQL_21000 [Myxococcota bacterium]
MSAPLLLTALLLAHVPGHLQPDEAFVLPAPEASAALFGVFVTGEERFVIRITHATRFATPIELMVPHEERLRAHRPAWALVGPGLPAPTDAERAALPAPLPDGFGAVVELNQEEPRRVLWESVMRRFFWTTGALAVVLPKGDSELWVWSPQKTTGKFGIGYGVEENGGYMKALEDWSFYAY